jgi:hypothetical protein
MHTYYFKHDTALHCLTSAPKAVQLRFSKKHEMRCKLANTFLHPQLSSKQLVLAYIAGQYRFKTYESLSLVLNAVSRTKITEREVLQYYPPKSQGLESAPLRIS